MKAASARRRLLAVATLALAPLLLSLALWVSQDHPGFLAVATVLAVVAFVAYLSLRSLSGALAGNSESAERARRELARTRDEAHPTLTAMGSAATGLVQGNRGLAERTEDQTSSLEQVAANIEELARGVKGNTHTARETQGVANLAGEATGKGIHATTMLIAQMETIHEATAKVADIVGVIDGIAFQTSLLALNASVEAARAGEQGRGFAVVAAEVRDLSLRCSVSARQIKVLVRSASDQVHASTAVVDEVAEAMAAINARVAEVNQLMNAIVAAGTGQSAGIAQVGRTIAQMEHATQRNAAFVGEIAAATESLTAQISRLASLALDSTAARATMAPGVTDGDGGARLRASHRALPSK